MIWQIRLALVVLLALGASVATAKYTNAIHAARTAKAEVAQMTEVIANQKHEQELLQARYDQLDAVLKEKQGYEDAIRKHLAGFSRKLEKLRQDDPAVRNWVDTPVPDPVRDLLREPTALSRNADSAGAPARSIDNPDAKS